jgi:hypothetical protein
MATENMTYSEVAQENNNATQNKESTQNTQPEYVEEETQHESEAEAQPNGHAPEAEDFPPLTHNDSHSDSSSSSSIDSGDHRFHVMERLTSFPIIADGLDLVSNYANNPDAPYGKYIKYTLDTANTTLNRVDDATKPIQNRFSSQINQLDQLACQSLDFIGDKFPLSKQPSKEIYASSVHLYEAARTEIDRNISKVVAPTQNFAKSVEQIVDQAISNGNALLNRVLPEEQNGESPDPSSTPAQKAYNLVAEAQRRVLKLARQQLDQVKSINTSDRLLKLKESNQIFNQAITQFEAINERILKVVDSTRQNAAHLQGATLEYIHASQAQLVQRTQDLTASFQNELSQASNFVQTTSQNLPQNVQTTIGYINQRFNVILNEATKPDQTAVERVKNATNATIESVPMLPETLDYINSFVPPFLRFRA